MKTKKSTLSKVLSAISKYRVQVFLSLVLAAVSAGSALYLPVLVGRAVDAILGPGNVNWQIVGKNLLVMGIMVGVGAAAQWVMNDLNNRVTCRVVRDLRNRAFTTIQHLPISYLDSHPVGETVSRLISDVDTLADGLLLGFTQLFSGVVTIAGTLAFLLTLSWQLALVVVVLTPLSMFVARYIAKNTHDMFVLQSKTKAEQTAFIDETVTGGKVVRAFGQESKCVEKFDEINTRLQQCSLRATFFSSITNPATRFVNNVVYACVALTGALLVIMGGGFTVGCLSACLGYANQYTKPFNEISGVITELQNAFACADRVFDLMEEKQEEETGTGMLISAEGEVKLENVSFRYVPDKPLIESLSIHANPGERVAIVGPTGCGKTTLINLLMRFYDPQKGTISVDGQENRSLTRASLRQCYGMVLQDTWLKAGTVRDNIAFGRPDATMEEIVEAAKAAHAHSFIRRLPNGYESVIGEDGGSLSQGQKQLICIARAMLCHPSMLILDEATSSIDTRTEIKVQKAFAKLVEGHTSFIVAHRLSTVREAELILVMRDGHIVEMGRHEELLAKNGFYAELYNSQFAKEMED